MTVTVRVVTVKSEPAEAGTVGGNAAAACWPVAPHHCGEDVNTGANLFLHACVQYDAPGASFFSIRSFHMQQKADPFGESVI